QYRGALRHRSITLSTHRAMSTNRLQQLHDAGQSIWLDFIDRTILLNGELAHRIEHDALTGMTSNPTIFEKALAEGSEYDEQLASAAPGATPWELFELVETDDVRTACDLFRPVFDATSGGDGFVSIEVSPGAANSADATVAEAMRLWKTVDRPNVMIKVPGTTEGAKAVRRLTANGVNVNITLLFSLSAYHAVIDAYMAGLEERVKAGKPIHGISSVASFFVSRVDTEVDKRLAALSPASEGDRRLTEALKGHIAIANAKLAYALFGETKSSTRWAALAAAGARVQRPLWASTSTKNPAYRDVMYVEDLIGPQTVNTMPPATIEAFRDHGRVERTVDQDVDAERQRIADLESLGITMKSVTDTLLTAGLASFQKSFDTLVSRLGQKVRTLAGT
ncbi:MAG TPA: transaldolase, partial [Gemmatimonadaceae bacterium]|nr:transaldolase [Gemmatimonadaceae bacterium]